MMTAKVGSAPSIPLATEIANPFIHKLELNTYDKIKVIMLTVTVLPFRIFMMLLLLTVAWLLAVVGLLGLSHDDLQQKPMTGWRRHYLKPFICLVLRLMFVLGGWHWVTVKGKQASAKEAPILTVAPHSSLFDVLPVVFLGGPSVVAKAESEQTPFFGTLINFTQPVYVRRHDPHSRQNTIQEILRRALAKEEEWDQVLIFPEGTCTNRSCLVSFKPGAFYPGVPVQPVCIKYPNRVDTVTWTWEGPGALKLLWLTLCQFHNYCEVEYLPVYTPNDAERKDPRLFAQNVRQLMANALETPLSYYSYDDLKFINWAAEHHVPQTPPMIKLLKFYKRQGLESINIDFEIEKFTNKLKKEERFCSLPEFASHLEVEVTDTIKDFFETMDQNNTGKIDTRGYIIGLFFLKIDLSFTNRLNNAFVFLSEGLDLIGIQEFCILSWLLLALSTSTALDVFHKMDTTNRGVVSLAMFNSLLSSGSLHHCTTHLQASLQLNGRPFYHTTEQAVSAVPGEDLYKSSDRAKDD